MKSFRSFGNTLLGLFCVVAFSVVAQGQGRETISGTVLSYGSGFNTRIRSAPFTLRIERHTSDQQAREFLGILQQQGQDDLLKAINDEDLGSFSVGNNLSRDLNVIRETMVDGKRRIIAVFERWMQFAEVRGGYRSTDYPFGYIDIYLDPVTGRGEGTYIAAARIKWREGKGSTGSYVEVEDFATFPARLLNVRTRGQIP